MKNTAALIILALQLCPAFLAAAEPITCVDTRDVWLSCATKDEADSSSGKYPRIKLKVLQEFGLLDFDVSKLKGRTIESASLFVAPDGGERFAPKGRGSDLRWFTVSTISSEWEEGLGAENYAHDDAGHGATFNEASYKKRPWTIPGSKCWDVTLGNGNSLRCDVDAGDPKNGWFEIPLDKRLVQARVAGASHGFMLMDGSTGIDRNSLISTREGKHPPYLLVKVSGEKTTAPAAPLNLSSKPAPNEASLEHGAAEISLTVPEGAFAFQIKLNNAPLPRWQIPFAAKAGSTQDFFLRHLPPDADFKIEVAAIDDAGNMSEFSAATGRSSAKITVPAIQIQPVAETPAHAESWLKLDGARSTFAEDAARGELVTVPFRIEKTAADIQIEVSNMAGVSHRVWRCWPVKVKDKWVSEYAIPVTEKLPVKIPDEQNKSGLQYADIVIDLIVAPDAVPGIRSGLVTVKAGAESRNFPVELHIHKAVIPAEIHFNPELNAYDEPGGAGSERCLDAHRIAHYNRCSINAVPYTQRGDMHAGAAPKVDADGHVTDWSVYDKNFGPLLDGSAFKDNPRAGIPVPVFYLPMNENWPLPMAANYHPGCPLTGQDWKPKHDLLAKPPEEAFTKEYQAAMTHVSRDFLKHFEEQKYTRTLAECFFNNKWHFSKLRLGGTAWTMDEPTDYLDWHALAFFSALFHDGIKNQSASHLVFRGDISRPMWQGNCMDGLIEIMYSGNGQFSMHPLMRESRRRMTATLYTYGSANNIGRSNLETVAWCLKAHCHDCDGVVPWQSLGGDDAFDIGDKPDSGNALIVDGRKRFGVNAIASLRVHAFRDGAQLCELLRLLEIKNGWSRAHSGALVSQVIPLGAEFKQGFQDDAAALEFKDLKTADFKNLKAAILRLLDQ